MSLPLFRRIGVPALVIIGLSLTGQAAFAQQQGWLFEPNYGRPTYPTRVVRTYTPSYALVAPVAPATPGTTIDLQVPAGAKVYFNGTATKQIGASRTFITGPLTPGVQYSYTVRVQWDDGGQVMERNRDISFMAGDQIRLDFTPTSLTAIR